MNRPELARFSMNSFTTETNVRRFQVEGSGGGRRSIMLPHDPLVSSILHLPGEQVSTYSEVMMGRWKLQNKNPVMRRCQDASLVISDDDGYHLAALFDGLGSLGSAIPEAMCQHLNLLWDEMGRRVSSTEEISEFLIEASRGAISFLTEEALRGYREELRLWEERFASIRKEDPEATPFPKPMVPEICNMGQFSGGTTAIVIILKPDGSYFIASAGDSAVYLMERGQIRRVLDFNTVWDDSEDRKGTMDISGLGLQTYSRIRNLVDSAIGIQAFDVPAMRKIDTCSGRLVRGDALIAATDGFTKNAKIILDAAGRIVDVSGELDIQRIIEMSREADTIGTNIIQLARGRMRLLKDKDSYLEVPYGNGQVLVPADDDLGVLVLKKES